MENGNELTPDFIYGQLPVDQSSTRGSLNWLHWKRDRWIKTVITSEFSVQVGMAVADITGNGKLDVIFGEWHNKWKWLKKKGSPGGNVYWAEQPGDPFQGNWLAHKLAAKCEDPHDILVGNISGENQPDIVIRNKNGKLSWFAKPNNVRKLWDETIIIHQLDGDGTALYDITGNGSMDIVTAKGYFKNIKGNGKEWEFTSFPVFDLNLHPETRVAVADLTNDGSITVIITESELNFRARIIMLNSPDRGRNWSRKVLIDKDRDFRGLHTLQLFDINGDGLLDIFVAEMEGDKTDCIVRKPKWKVFLNKGKLIFTEYTIFDHNLGAHQGTIGFLRKTGNPEIIAKDWLPNINNACGGKNHIVHIYDLNKR